MGYGHNPVGVAEINAAVPKVAEYSNLGIQNEEERSTARSSAEPLAEGFFVSGHRQRQTLSNHRKS